MGLWAYGLLGIGIGLRDYGVRDRVMGLGIRLWG